MAGKEIPKLLAVTLVRSGIGKPYWQRRTLEALGLVKRHKTIIHKNSESVVGMLSSVKELVHVRPVVLRTDLENSPNRDTFLLDNGEVFVGLDQQQKDSLKITNDHHVENTSTIVAT